MPIPTITIEGQRPGSTAWGTVDALRQENAAAIEHNDATLIERSSADRLAAWQRSSADLSGAFHGWRFRLARS